MDALYFKVPRLSEETIRIEFWDMPHFYDPLHFHEDCQITLILDGEGLIISNNSVDSFTHCDVLVFGSNMEHVLRNSEKYYIHNSKIIAKAITIFFDEETIRELIQLIPEFRDLVSLIEAMKYGIKISLGSQSKIISLIQSLPEKQGVSKILLFLEILNQISNCNNLNVLSESILPVSNPESMIKLKKVYDYILENFRQKIKLADVASLLNMSPNVFCKFFKNRTNKTFTGLLIEVRINQICKLLASGNFNVTEAYLMCGYNNSTNFHKHFLKVTGLTPTEYKEKLKK